MADRTFIDPDGQAWHVWAVQPSPRADRPTPAAAFAPGYADGWLVFERSPTAPTAAGDLAPRHVAPAGAQTTNPPADKRRYAPVPAGWDRTSDAQLAAWLAAAAPVTPRLRSGLAAGRAADRPPPA